MKRHNALFHLFENEQVESALTYHLFESLPPLPHMRTSISPDPWLVYIPLNRSKCIITFKKVCRLCERRTRHEKA